MSIRFCDFYIKKLFIKNLYNKPFSCFFRIFVAIYLNLNGENLPISIFFIFIANNDKT